jgi:superoxide dismutase
MDLWNQIASDHSQAAVDAGPVLALDMYEHAYHRDIGANAKRSRVTCLCAVMELRGGH